MSLNILPRPNTSSAFLDGGRGIAIVGVGVDPRLDEPPPVLGGRAGGASPSTSLRISLSSVTQWQTLLSY